MTDGAVRQTISINDIAAPVIQIVAILGTLPRTIKAWSGRRPLPSARWKCGDAISGSLGRGQSRAPRFVSWGIAQPGGAEVLDASGRRFEPCRIRQQTQSVNGIIETNGFAGKSLRAMIVAPRVPPLARLRLALAADLQTRRTRQLTPRALHNICQRFRRIN